MNDIYSTINKLTVDLIEAVYPAEDEGKISPVSLKCEIAKGNVTYYVTNKRDSKGNYESDIKADTEDEAILKEKRAIIQALDICLSNPRTIKDIKDGEVTVIEAAREVLQVYEVLPEALEEVKSSHTSEPETTAAKKRIVEAVEADETEDEKKPHLFEAVKAAGSKGITLSADNIGDFDFSGLEFWTPEAELSLAKAISECLNAPNVVESIKNGTTTTEEAVKDIIATFKETHEGNLIYKFAADAEAKPKATPKAE